jgi:integrase
MPYRRKDSRVPRYLYHKARDCAKVVIDGRTYYLGPWKSKASLLEYDRLISEWLANGRTSGQAGQEQKLTVNELIAAYWKHAKQYYGDTSTLRNLKAVLRLLREGYGHTAAVDFGPLALKALRLKMIEADQSRTTVNANIRDIKRAFKWGVSEQLLPPTVYQALTTVEGLRKGRSAARDGGPVQPVDDETVQKTLEHLPTVVAGMVRFQRLTGVRPGELCIVRPMDVERSGDVWEYRPESHKTEHCSRHRVIFIGPRGQDVLRPYLLREATAYCFSPAESEKKRRAQMHEKRKMPLSRGNRPGTNRKTKPKRQPADRYTADSYRRAVHRACKRAGVAKWSPNQLRHTAATEIRRKYGLEGAQVALGHARADVTQVYAERDYAKAAAIMLEVG